MLQKKMKEFCFPRKFEWSVLDTDRLLIVGPGKSWKIKELFNRCVSADDKGRAMLIQTRNQNARTTHILMDTRVCVR